MVRHIPVAPQVSEKRVFQKPAKHPPRPPTVVDDLIDRFCDAVWLEHGLSPRTLSAYRSDLILLDRWLQRRGGALATATREELRAYIRDRAGIGKRTAARRLSSMRRFYHYLVREAGIEANPTELLDAPKLDRPLPKTLSETQVERLLAAPDIATPLGLRDRAMIETLYATGLRVSELVGLALSQLGLTQGVVRVIGKGDKERLVPLGEEALVWLRRYLADSRSTLVRGRATEAVFVTARGSGLTRQAFWHNIKRHARTAGIDARLSPHTVRHAFATHLLNHGADLRVIQMLLGHADLSTTQIYTQVARTRLKDLHARHHPRG